MTVDEGGRPTAQAELATNELIGGRFSLREQVGEGGYGAVFRARDEATGGLVALKLLRRGQTDLPRFRREIELLATVRHPNVVAYVAHGLTGAGVPYFAMEWLDGSDLAARLGQGPLSVDEALALGLAAAQGLAAVHARGIVHRDVKPSNLFLVGGYPGDPRLIDFGIARVDDADTKLTTTGNLLGTPAYMAPEQARSEGLISSRTDVYALGGVLFHALTGTLPFQDPSALAILGKLMTSEPPRLRERRSDLPAAVDGLVARMLTRDPADRFSDGAAVAMAISELLRGSEGGSLPTTLPRAAVSSSMSRARAYLVISSHDGVQPARDVADQLSVFGGEITYRGSNRLVAIFTRETTVAAAGRAARCAVEIRSRHPRLSLGVTIAAVVGGAGEQPPTDIDFDSVGLGQIALDSESARRLAGEYEIAPGNPDPILLRAREGRDWTGPLLGRGAELAVLEGAFVAALDERSARVALVVGEPGIGKSRLLSELGERLRGHPAAPTLLTGRSDRSTVAAPFALIRTLVLSWLIGDDQREQLGRIGVGGADAEGVLDLARPREQPGAMIDRDPIAVADGYRVGFLAALESLLKAAPVVIVVEDLHWTDQTSLATLALAAREMGDHPLVIVGSSRLGNDGALSVFDHLDPQRLELRPLRRRVAADFVRTVLPAADEEAVQRIVVQAGGNPLRLGELCYLGDDPLRSSSMSEVIGARIARLDLEVQRVLRAGSVFGERFSIEGIAALLGGVGRLGDVESAIGTATRERLIRPDGGGHFVFFHGLMQEASYATLPIVDRRAAHSAAARWLEAEAGADPSVLAWHFDRASESADAFRWYEAAARRALGGRDLDRASQLAGKALACEPRGDDRARALTLQAEIALVSGDAESGQRAAGEALEAAVPGGPVWMVAAGIQISCVGQAGRNDEVGRIAERVRLQPTVPQAAAARALCLCRGATQRFSAGERAAARALMDEAEKACGDEPMVKAWLLHLQGGFANLDRDFERSSAIFDESARLLAAVGDLRGACHKRILKASTLVFIGHFEGATTELDVADAIARRSGADFLRAWVAYTRGKILALVGDPATARSHMEKVRRSVTQHPRIVAGTHVYLAIAALRAGDAGWAEAEARAAIAVHSAPASRAAALAALARALVLAGRIEDALSASAEAQAIVRSMGDLEENESLVMLAQIETLAAAGREEAAAAAAHSALDKLLTIGRKITTLARREGFLHGIDMHASTLQWAHRLGVGGTDW